MRMFKRAKISAMDKLTGSLTQGKINRNFARYRGVSSTNHQFLKSVNDELYATGYNTSGQLGISTQNTVRTFIKTLGIIGTIKSISQTSDDSTFVLTEEGSLYFSGAGEASTRGGLGATSNSFILLMSGIKEISNFGKNTFILKYDNSLWGAGVNSYYQLSGGGGKSVFTQITTNVADMALGLYHSLILKLDGTVWVCGGSGSSGMGEYTSASTALRQIMSLPSDKTPKAVYANYYSSVVEMTDGTFYGSGNTTNGELGLNTTSRITSFVKMFDSYPYPVKKFSLGRQHSAVLFENGDLYTCGNNTTGKLGDNTTNNSSVYKNIISDVVDVLCSGNNTFIIKNDNVIYGCGSKSELGINYNTGTQLTFIPISI